MSEATKTLNTQKEKENSSFWENLLCNSGRILGLWNSFYYLEFHFDGTTYDPYSGCSSRGRCVQKVLEF